MGLGGALEDVYHHYVSDIHLVGRFASLVDATVTRKEKAKRPLPKEWTDEDTRQFRELRSFFDNLIDGGHKNSKGRVEVTAPRVMAIVEEMLETQIFPMTYRKFLAEMVLVYLVSLQEAYVRDYLEELLTARNELLRSGKQLAVEEVCQFKTIRSLHRYLAEKEIGNLMYQDIDRQAEYFENKFNIAFPRDFPDWPTVREASYRRNLIVHNRGVTNDVYRAKTGYPRRGEELVTDSQYVERLQVALLKFLEFCHTSMLRKFRLRGALVGREGKSPSDPA